MGLTLSAGALPAPRHRRSRWRLRGLLGGSWPHWVTGLPATAGLACRACRRERCDQCEGNGCGCQECAGGEG